MLKKIWSSDAVVLLRRMLIVYLLLALCRVIFYIYNYDIIGPIDSWTEFVSLFRGSFMFDSVSLVYSNVLFVLLSLLPLRLRERNWYRAMLFWLFIVVNSLVVAVNLADTIYFHYTQIRLTAADVIFADNDNTGALMWQFAVENWYLVLVWGALIAGMVVLYRFSGKPVTPIRNNWVFGVVNTLIMLAGLTVAIAMVRGGGLSRDIRPIHLSNSMSYTSSPAKANMILSNPFCIIRTMSNRGIHYKKYFTEEELASIFTPYHYPPDADREEALAERKNVMLFILESFSAEHSALLNPDLYPEGGGFTPFLDSLMREGYYFQRAYTGGAKSIDALPSMLGSMPSFKMPFVTMPQSLGEGMQLPKILRGEGYNTLFFNGSPHGSMGFDAYASLAGIDEIYDGDDYDARYPGHKDFDGWWGIWDEPFIQYAGAVLDEIQQPFNATLFTITSHHPFRIPQQYEGVFPEGKTRIHKGVGYTDMAVRRFFEEYGDREWFQNTIFVFCGDHVSSERFAEKTETSVGRTHVMAFIYTPDGSLKGYNEEVFSQLDIMPTALGLLGYNRPYFAFGRDALREPERMPMAVNYNNSFQIITDSLSLIYDEQNVVSAYLASDALQHDDIANSSDPMQQETLRMLQAVIQQYYSHLESRNYTVPD